MLNRVFFVGITSVAAIATAFAYGIGGHLAISGSLTVGTLLAITALLARLYGPLTALSNVRIDVMTALVSFERVFEVLDLQPMITDKPGAAVLTDKQAKVEFKNVRFAYPKAEEISLASLESAAKPETVDSGDLRESHLLQRPEL
jgi:ATP-binding cassette subfamily B protein